MTLEELEAMCDQCQSPMGIVLKIPGYAKKRGQRRRMVLPGVYGVILAEQDRGREETVVAVKVADMRRFIAKQRILPQIVDPDLTLPDPRID